MHWGRGGSGLWATVSKCLQWLKSESCVTEKMKVKFEIQVSQSLPHLSDFDSRIIKLLAEHHLPEHQKQLCKLDPATNRSRRLSY
jgi:hypothetical protein